MKPSAGLRMKQQTSIASATAANVVQYMSINA